MRIAIRLLLLGACLLTTNHCSLAIADRYIAEVFSLHNWNSYTAKDVNPRGFVELHTNELIWEIPGIGPQHVGTTWTLNKSTAPSFGFDWEKAVELVGKGNFYVQATVDWPGQSNNLIKKCCAGSSHLDLDRLEFTLLSWKQSPHPQFAGVVNYEAPTRLKIFAETPEPSALALFAIGCAAIGCRRRR